MNDRRLIYSSDGGRVGPRQERQQAKASTRRAPVLPADGVVRIFHERGGRGGKTVTVVRGLSERGPDLEALAGDLKRLCGAGGTTRDGEIEIQGDHRKRIAERLRALGCRVKLAGG